MKLGVAACVAGDQVVPGDIEVEEGVVTRIGLPPGRSDLRAVPGFTDVHLHGHRGIEFADSTMDSP